MLASLLDCVLRLPAPDPIIFNGKDAAFQTNTAALSMLHTIRCRGHTTVWDTNLMTKDEFDPDVIQACQQRVDKFYTAACDLWVKTVDDVLATAKAHDHASAAALFERIEHVQVAGSDDDSLLTITPSGMPAFLLGERRAFCDVPDVVPPKEWNRQIPFAD